MVCGPAWVMMGSLVRYCWGHILSWSIMGSFLESATSARATIAVIEKIHSSNSMDGCKGINTMVVELVPSAVTKELSCAKSS